MDYYLRLLSEKGGYHLICDNMDRPRAHAAKWGKPDRVKQVLWDHLYVESNKVKPVKQRELKGCYQVMLGGGGDGVLGYKPLRSIQ